MVRPKSKATELSNLGTLAELALTSTPSAANNKHHHELFGTGPISQTALLADGNHRGTTSGLGGVGVGAGVGIDTTMAPAHYYDTTPLLPNIPLSDGDEDGGGRYRAEGESDFNFFGSGNARNGHGIGLSGTGRDAEFDSSAQHHDGNAFASGSGLVHKSTNDVPSEEEDEEEESDDEEEGLDDIATLKVLQKMDEDADVAFAANIRYQSEVLAVMKKLARATTRTDELQVLVKDFNLELEKGSEMTLVAPGTTRPTLPWFRYHHGQELPDNPEGAARDLYLSTIRHVPWTTAERASLKSEIVAHNNREVARTASEEGQDIDEALAARPASFYVETLDNVDWEKIALPLTRRSPLECKMQWLQHDHPHVNLKRWTADELTQLYAIAAAHGERDWAAICTELGTRRTPVECLKKYRQRPGQRRDWTAEEDELLRAGVKLYGLNWQAVAYHVGRHSNQCINRWTKSLRPAIVRGKWTPEEDALLLAAVTACGPSWKHVEARVKGRTDAQCRERWVNKVNPSLRSPKVWTAEEDATILALRAEGKSWSEIANTFVDGARTDNHCHRRHQWLAKVLENPELGIKKDRRKGKGKAVTVETEKVEGDADLEEGGETGNDGEVINGDSTKSNTGDIVVSTDSSIIAKGKQKRKTTQITETPGEEGEPPKKRGKPRATRKKTTEPAMSEDQITLAVKAVANGSGAMEVELPGVENEANAGENSAVIEGEERIVAEAEVGGGVDEPRKSGRKRKTLTD